MYNDKPEQPIPKSTILFQKDEILKSEYFKNAPNMIRLFDYLVQMMLDGREEELKERNIGIDVFDRPENFDPRLDPVVRINAGRLREKLDAFRGTNGHHNDQVNISLPRGRYKLKFDPPE